MPLYEFTHIVTGATQRHDLSLNGDVKSLLGDDDYGTYSVRRVEPEKLSDPVTVEIVDTSPATAPVIATLPDGTAEITARDGEITVTFTEPAIYAGTYTIDTADFEGGPVNLVAPSISGTTAEEDVLTAVPGLWVGDVARGAISITADWHRDGVETPGERQLTREVYPEDPGTSLTYVETAQVGVDERTAASNAIDVPALPSGDFAPASLGADLIANWDFSDRATLFQDWPGTVAAANIGDPVNTIHDVSGNGYHVSAIGDQALRFETGNGLVVDGALDYNGAGFQVQSTIAGLTSDMDVFVVLDPQADAQYYLGGTDTDRVSRFGHVSQNAFGAGDNDVGEAVTYAVNGVTVADDHNDGLYDAIQGKSLVAIRGLDLTINSAWPSEFMPLGYDHPNLRSEVIAYQYIVTKRLTDAQHAEMTAYLTAKFSIGA